MKNNNEGKQTIEEKINEPEIETNGQNTVSDDNRKKHNNEKIMACQECHNI